MARYEQTTTWQGVPVPKRSPGMMRTDWRCTTCGALLGKIGPADVHISFARTPDYIASLPVSAVCRKCRTLNRTGS